MTEKYLGVRFKTVFLKKKIPKNKKIKTLNKWCKKFSKAKLAPKIGKGSAGNMSFRTKNGFIITDSNSDLGKMKKQDFVEVVNVNLKTKTIKVIGKRVPSSEAMLHNVIYKKRKDINAIFHGHKKKKCPTTKKEKPYGTIDLVKEVLKILKNNNLICMKNHGFISMGKTMDKAGKLILS